MTHGPKSRASSFLLKWAVWAAVLWDRWERHVKIFWAPRTVEPQLHSIGDIAFC